MVSYTALLAAFAAVTGVIATPVTSPAQDTPDSPFDLMRRQGITPNSAGMHSSGYYYSWWSDGASPVTYTNLDGGAYSVNWASGGNLVGGKGWNPGSAKVIKYSGTWTPVNNGNAYLTIYGWTKNPLVEYYIVENHGEYNPGNSAQARGQVQHDGGTYMLYESTRNQQPSIEGTRTFQQYWAIRQQKRTGGSVDTGVFFSAWEAANMKMGTHDYMVVATEAYRSAGQSNIVVETPP